MNEQLHSEMPSLDDLKDLETQILEAEKKFWDACYTVPEGIHFLSLNNDWLIDISNARRARSWKTALSLMNLIQRKLHISKAGLVPGIKKTFEQFHDLIHRRYNIATSV